MAYANILSEHSCCSFPIKFRMIFFYFDWQIYIYVHGIHMHMYTANGCSAIANHYFMIRTKLLRLVSNLYLILKRIFERIQITVLFGI